MERRMSVVRLIEKRSNGMDKFYVRVKGRAVEADYDTWLESNLRESNQIRRTYVDGFLVSTIFLWFDHRHRYDRGGEPLLWETMSFRGGWTEIDAERYTSEKEAIAGHKLIVRKYRSAALKRNPRKYKNEAIRAMRKGQFVQWAEKFHYDDRLSESLEAMEIVARGVGRLGQSISKLTYEIGELTSNAFAGGFLEGLGPLQEVGEDNG